MGAFAVAAAVAMVGAMAGRVGAAAAGPAPAGAAAGVKLHRLFGDNCVLQRRLKVPVGVICISYGWTPAEAWMSREALSADAQIKRDVLHVWDRWVEEYPPRAKAYADRLAAWEKAAKDAVAAGEPAPLTPKPPAPPNPGPPRTWMLDIWCFRSVLPP